MTQSYDKLLDVTGLTCPLPVLRAQKFLREVPQGAIVKVLATDPIAAIDFPHFCQESGHKLLEHALLKMENSDDIFIFYIKCIKRELQANSDATTA